MEHKNKQHPSMSTRDNEAHAFTRMAFTYKNEFMQTKVAEKGPWIYPSIRYGRYTDRKTAVVISSYAVFDNSLLVLHKKKVKMLESISF